MMVISPQVPFPEAVALNTERLAKSPSTALQSQNPTSTTLFPFENSDELLPYVPGEPTLTASEVHSFLAKELDMPVLDELYPRL
jgi:hypothetical protein